ncbi:MAG: SUMF1/EgtB/PvdO family nonheme iron enzyme [Bacteroidia bacterium]|jgi:sulfatase modifying factor 1|nr:gliding motility-associated lipoprotein [Bacteroidia bacterium]NBY11049.1 gliding motility-associated lipoprotein [Sphingobacteriia bacterium]
MKKLTFLFIALIFVTSCNERSGELVGVEGRERWFQPDPFGTLFVPMGAFHMGPDDEEAPMAHTTKSKMVSVQAFYVDDSEITNNEYRQFVFWVRDSIARRLLIDGGKDQEFGITQADFLQTWPVYTGDKNLQDPYINWNNPIDWNSGAEDVREILRPMYLPEGERFYNRKEIDTRKLNYEYYRIDIRLAASKTNRFKPSRSFDTSKDKKAKNKKYINGTTKNDGNYLGDKKVADKTKDPTEDPTNAETNLGRYDVTYPTREYAPSFSDGLYSKKGNVKELDRSAFIVKDIINVYPDTLAWIHDFTYAFNEPMTNMYFWHPAYDDYPVVGVTWKQARAFSIWRSHLLNNYLIGTGQSIVNDFRLPTESEWEYAARGGLDKSPYPWGGPYTRNAKGCFLANFKPMRGTLVDDGGFHTVYVYSYNPNDFGLYCMSGNAAEWTSNAFDESAYDFQSDLNPDFTFEASDDETKNVLKRKVIRGGSWKDVGYYIQNSARTYEYQDTAKCYIGFRNVMTYLGRSKFDDI